MWNKWNRSNITNWRWKLCWKWIIVPNKIDHTTTKWLNKERAACSSKSCHIEYSSNKTKSTILRLIRNIQNICLTMMPLTMLPLTHYVYISVVWYSKVKIGFLFGGSCRVQCHLISLRKVVNLLGKSAMWLKWDLLYLCKHFPSLVE